MSPVKNMQRRSLFVVTEPTFYMVSRALCLNERSERSFSTPSPKLGKKNTLAVEGMSLTILKHR